MTTSTLVQGRLTTALMLLLALQSWVKTLVPLAQPAMPLMMTLLTLALPSLGEDRPAMEIRAVLLLTCSVGHQLLLLPQVNSQPTYLAQFLLWQHLPPPLLPRLTSLEVLLLRLLLHKLGHLQPLELLFQARQLLKPKVHPPWTCLQV